MELTISVTYFDFCDTWQILIYDRITGAVIYDSLAV